MTLEPDGVAIVYCEGAFGSTNGKTAHGLVRRTRRYRVAATVDSTCSGRDAGEFLDGSPNGISIEPSIASAIARCRARAIEPTHLVIGLAPDGGRMSLSTRQHVIEAIDAGLHVDAGLHDFLTDDRGIAELAAQRGVRLRDVRKPPGRELLHAFTGKIEQVDCLKVAVLGTDSAVGKRTTAWILVDALLRLGKKAELIGTGQTAWMQGARYGIILDSLVNDFVAGEIEHAVWSAWQAERPDVLVIEGQGSLMNPAYPGGLEILAASRPNCIVLQHAPARKEYDGFPGFPIHPLNVQIHALELVSGKPVVAVTVNPERLADSQIASACGDIHSSTGRPAWNVLRDGADALARWILDAVPSANMSSC